jgi:hypothetical protein
MIGQDIWFCITIIPFGLKVFKKYFLNGDSITKNLRYGNNPRNLLDVSLPCLLLDFKILLEIIQDSIGDRVRKSNEIIVEINVNTVADDLRSSATVLTLTSTIIFII